MGDVALTNISRETNYFHDLCSIRDKDKDTDKESSLFLNIGYFLSMSINFGQFFFIKKSIYYVVLSQRVSYFSFFAFDSVRCEHILTTAIFQHVALNCE